MNTLPKMAYLRTFLAFLCAGAIIAALSVFFLYRHISAGREAENQAALNLKKADISVTIPEGKRREEIAVLMADKGICTVAQFLAASVDKEGSLFPDTYRFFPDTPASEVVATLTSTFKTKTAALNPTPSDLILASIVEREARNDSERSDIAGVYTNRLKIGMKLDADPTVQYAKDTANYASSAPSYTFWKPITQEEYQSVISPFNTYRTTGLPPAPIANPGLASITAAMNPSEHDYLYFLHTADGRILFAKTFAQHQQNQVAN